jgi:aspartate oxidase
MFKRQCENCTRILVCEAVRGEGKSFCDYECRLNWLRVMRRFEVAGRTGAAVRNR